jgi:hypothetical protein
VIQLFDFVVQDVGIPSEQAAALLKDFLVDGFQNSKTLWERKAFLEDMRN